MDGKYKISASTPIGPYEGTITFESAENGLRVNLVLLGNDIRADGRKSGGAFSFDCDVDTDYGPQALHFEGTVSGEELAARAYTYYGDVVLTGKKCDE